MEINIWELFCLNFFWEFPRNSFFCMLPKAESVIRYIDTTQCLLIIFLFQDSPSATKLYHEWFSYEGFLISNEKFWSELLKEKQNFYWNYFCWNVVFQVKFKSVLLPCCVFHIQRSQVQKRVSLCSWSSNGDMPEEFTKKSSAQCSWVSPFFLIFFN